jgi:hypothetical protein
MPDQPVSNPWCRHALRDLAGVVSHDGRIKAKLPNTIGDLIELKLRMLPQHPEW